MNLNVDAVILQLKGTACWVARSLLCLALHRRSKEATVRKCCAETSEAKKRGGGGTSHGNKHWLKNHFETWNIMARFFTSWFWCYGKWCKLAGSAAAQQRPWRDPSRGSQTFVWCLLRVLVNGYIEIGSINWTSAFVNESVIFNIHV